MFFVLKDGTSIHDAIVLYAISIEIEPTYYM